jgi:hypothetical protein
VPWSTLARSSAHRATQMGNFRARCLHPFTTPLASCILHPVGTNRYRLRQSAGVSTEPRAGQTSNRTLRNMTPRTRPLRTTTRSTTPNRMVARWRPSSDLRAKLSWRTWRRGRRLMVRAKLQMCLMRGMRTGGGHLWPGLAGKTPFPESWSAAEVMNAISDVATDPASSRVVQGGATIVNGTREGVDIQVIVNNSTDQIVSGYPTNLPRNP